MLEQCNIHPRQKLKNMKPLSFFKNTQFIKFQTSKLKKPGEKDINRLKDIKLYHGFTVPCSSIFPK